jgi:hypothetical protein
VSSPLAGSFVVRPAVLVPSRSYGGVSVWRSINNEYPADVFENARNHLQTLIGSASADAEYAVSVAVSFQQVLAVQQPAPSVAAVVPPLVPEAAP